MGRYSRRPGSGREWVSAETFGDGMAARESAISGELVAHMHQATLRHGTPNRFRSSQLASNTSRSGRRCSTSRKRHHAAACAIWCSAQATGAASVVQRGRRRKKFMHHRFQGERRGTQQSRGSGHPDRIVPHPSSRDCFTPARLVITGCRHRPQGTPWDEPDTGRSGDRNRCVG